MDIFHELRQEEVKCYVLIKPQHKNVIEELKSREGLTFYWEEDLGLRGSIFYSHELMPAWIGVFSIEAYSAAGGMGFGWWLVEHYLSYHVNCPDGCGLGESTRGRKDSPYFQMSYGSFDNIPDLIDPFVELPLPLQQGFTRSSLERCIAP